jgi:hypothetical protein
VERSCFLCGGRAEPVWADRWYPPGLDEATIGFGACTSCGMVLQSPTVPPPAMRRYYEEAAVYTNPGRDGAPHPGKVAAVDAQLELVREALGAVPASAYQAGCSDGYTLARFRDAGATRVSGCDPAPRSAALAGERYGVDVEVATLEELGAPPGAALWILTHVLEHLYDPLTALRAVRGVQGPGDALLVEVPLLAEPGDLPPGYFAFEHLEYFTEHTLRRTLERAGYEVAAVRTQAASDHYPVITVVARTAQPTPFTVQTSDPLEVALAQGCLARYRAREVSVWRDMEDRVAASLAPGAPLWIWGAGVHTTQLLASTDVADRYSVRGLFDSEPAKWGMQLGPFRCHDPASVELGAGDALLISTRSGEAELLRALEPERDRGAKVIGLYGSSG